MPSSTAVTLDVLISYLNCRHKAYLQITGHEGSKSDYEIMVTQSGLEARRRIAEKIKERYLCSELIPDAALVRSELRKGAAFISGAHLKDGGFSVNFDGLQKVAGTSDLGDFHYIPVMYCEGRQVRKAQRLLLAALGLLLSRAQGKAPNRGIIYHGHDAKVTTVRISPNVKAAQAVLDEIEQVQRGTAVPNLILNDHCQICEFRSHCHARAIEADNLSLLRGLGEREIKRYGRKGVFTLTQLAHTFRLRREGKRSDRQRKRRYHALQALAIRDKRVYVLGAPTVPSEAVQIYLDVEGDPAEGCIYLIGMIVCDGDGEHRYSFWADTKEQERHIFEQFLYIVSRYERLCIYCYGNYERAFIKRMRQHARRKKQADKALDALVNTLSIVYEHFYFPSFSNGLKGVGGSIGCSWSDKNASGFQSIAWRMRWERTQDDQWRTKLINYNMEDCAALRAVTDFLRGASVEAAAPPKALSVDGVTLQVVQVKDLDKLAYPQRWRRPEFLNADFEAVNNCAYFDYQRQRVFVRTSKTIRKYIRKPGLHHNRKIRVSKRLEITATKCPGCDSTEITRLQKLKLAGGRNTRVKRAFDVAATSEGMRRQVIECKAAAYQCARCGHCFTSERYHRLAKHFHGLMSWAMYLHVAHRLSMRTIQEMLREFFDLSVGNQEIHMFKSLMARKYRATYRKLLSKIVSAPVVHADETEVKLRSGKGYVWVFTSLEEVVFMYRPTREGQFLREVLEGFKGVLISDFYAAYDSLDCAHQKCLIHLIRDMNQELLQNPYDNELQSVTQAFGSLLRRIVATIDERGLKRKYLQRHAGEVAGFLQGLSSQSFHSDSAQALQQRLTKYQDKLFTFVQHDGVTWNNNNAENAIKQFAFYRENTVGIMNETGLGDYLVLLSVYASCRYRGVSFLKFLLSKERDVDVFCAKGRKRRRNSALELYPKGFIPPHLAGLRRKAAQKAAQQSVPEP